MDQEQVRNILKNAGVNLGTEQCNIQKVWGIRADYCNTQKTGPSKTHPLATISSTTF